MGASLARSNCSSSLTSLAWSSRKVENLGFGRTAGNGVSGASSLLSCISVPILRQHIANSAPTHLSVDVGLGRLHSPAQAVEVTRVDRLGRRGVGARE